MAHVITQIILFVSISSAINILKDGPIEYCNVDPSHWDFKPLKESDIKRIKKLEQGTKTTKYVMTMICKH